MAVTETVTDGTARIRVRAWRGRADTAELAPTPAGAPSTSALVSEAVESAARAGFSHVVTPALPPTDWRPFTDHGFEIRERLHLLAHDLFDVPARFSEVRLRRATRTDQRRILAIDAAAFDAFWTLDADALVDAVGATPSSRLRISRDEGGYALFGRAGDRGYLQRLAVDPDREGHGLGTALVVDGLQWLRRRRVEEVLVNTQESNTRAVALYERLGFRRRSTGLAVLHRSTAAPGPT